MPAALMGEPRLVRVASTSRYASQIGFSAAVSAAGWVTLAGVTAFDPHGTIAGDGDAYLQARECLAKIERVLSEFGATLASVVQTRMYLTRVEDWPEVGRAHGECFAVDRPAATMVVVAQLLDPRLLVEIEAIAFTG